MSIPLFVGETSGSAKANTQPDSSPPQADQNDTHQYKIAFLVPDKPRCLTFTK